MDINVTEKAGLSLALETVNSTIEDGSSLPDDCPNKRCV